MIQYFTTGIPSLLLSRQLWGITLSAHASTCQTIDGLLRRGVCEASRVIMSPKNLDRMCNAGGSCLRCLVIGDCDMFLLQKAIFDGQILNDTKIGPKEIYMCSTFTVMLR
jgi:hypothetical protein